MLIQRITTSTLLYITLWAVYTRVFNVRLMFPIFSSRYTWTEVHFKRPKRNDEKRLWRHARVIDFFN
jgi:hypothetical protein